MADRSSGCGRQRGGQLVGATAGTPQDGPGKSTANIRGVPEQDRTKIAQNDLDRFRKDVGRRLPENQAVAKEKEVEEVDGAREEEEGEGVEALAPERWVNPSIPPLLSFANGGFCFI